MKTPTQEEWVRCKAQRSEAAQQPQGASQAASKLPDDLFLPDDYVAPKASSAAPKAKWRPKRLQPLSEAYARARLRWLHESHTPSPFSYHARLFLHLLYKSHDGQKEVRVTNEVAAEIGMPEWVKRRSLAYLIRIGWVRVERREEPSHTLVVTLTPPAQ
jgi:hypothetical protein